MPPKAPQKPKANLRILGIDPGYDRCGFAILEKSSDGKEKLVHSECFTTSKSLPYLSRLRLVGGRLEALLEEYSPTAVAIEKLYFENNQKSAMAVAEVRGAFLYLSEKSGIPLSEYTPLQVKAAVTSYGRSDKKQVAMMVEKLLRLPKPLRYDDEYDAIALALTASASLRL